MCSRKGTTSYPTALADQLPLGRKSYPLALAGRGPKGSRKSRNHFTHTQGRRASDTASAYRERTKPYPFLHLIPCQQMAPWFLLATAYSIT
ncbi:hypothetical protein NPIL_542371 [Nephila pilipes]|uniref:Uncharacterized protein n=1 Tax=Nephila pilipes TaxID=299642 RepID=A0A8X6U2M9_NEPPI|nr:hypothetical protein NPIL_542371 [Nephila pilipes]